MAFARRPAADHGGDRRAQRARQRGAQARYLAKLVSGEWTGTMQLTEPQAGSDVGALRTRAERAGDGSYRITGQKIFITYGEHDLTDNIIHFVLARLPDAPPGTRGISLFLVPKFLLNADGSLGARNDVRAHSVEHKLGIHGSPTCTMIFGDKGGAIGFLVGEENAGMACMFTMMNRARLAVGLQGVGVAERATQQALAYARDRRQGRAAGTPATQSAPIIAHPDVRRMLLTMRALTQARARHLLRDRDRARPRRHAPDDAARMAAQRARRAADAGRQGLLDRHRHRGRLARRAGAWRHGLHRGDRRRAAFIATRASRRSTRAPTASRRSTSSTRKLPLGGGAAVELYLAELRASSKRVNASNDPALGWTGVRLARGGQKSGAGDRLDGCPARHGRRRKRWPAPRPICGCSARRAGGCLLAQQALAAVRLGTDAAARIALARFFAENFAVQAPALEHTVVEGGQRACLTRRCAALACQTWPSRRAL